MSCLVGSLCYLEMIEDSKECDKMFNEVDDGEWDISDDNDSELQSHSKKDWDKFKANVKEMKIFKVSLLCFVDF